MGMAGMGREGREREAGAEVREVAMDSGERV